MTSQQIEYFLMLSKHLNFTKAARYLYVSQPAISRQIAALETELDLSLFDRAYHDLKLTKSGEILYEALSKVDFILKSAVNEARKVAEGGRKSLSVGIITGWNINNLMPNAVELLSSERPELNLSFESQVRNKLILALQENRLDLIVLPSFEAENPADFSIQEVRRVHPRLFYSEKHPLAGNRNVVLNDFKYETFFIPGRDDDIDSLRQFRQYSEHFSFAPCCMESPNTESMIQSVAAGLGVMLLDELHRLADNQIMRILDLSTTFRIDAVYKTSNENAAIKWFIEKLCESR